MLGEKKKRDAAQGPGDPSTKKRALGKGKYLKEKTDTRGKHGPVCEKTV